MCLKLLRKIIKKNSSLHIFYKKIKYVLHLLFCSAKSIDKKFILYREFVNENSKELLKNGGGVAICCIVKNEAPYIKEWIEFHLLVGVKMFFIYDNESTDNLKEILKSYIETGIVVYAYVKGTAMQYPVYNDCIANYKNCCDWIAFIDADEFLVPVKNDSLSDILDDFKTYAGVGVNWVFFDSNGHNKKPDGLVIENYTRVEADFDCERCRVIKSIVNPRKVKFCYHPHFFVYRFGEKCVDVNKIPTDFYFTKHNSRDVVRVNHYYTKSKEEYLEKINRGMADFKNAKRKEINLSDVNFPNGVEDTTILHFLPLLKEKLSISEVSTC